MPKVAAQIPDDIYKKINEEVNLGIFPNISSAINAALQKSYAKKSRAYLKWLLKKEGIKEPDLLKDLESLRK